jgi:hypothetical protein
LQLKYKDTKRLVDSCYRVRKVPVIDDGGRPTGQSTSVWTEWDDTNDPIEKELREWLGIVPWEWQLRQNSLLPVATSFQAAYVKINASTLFGLFARLRKC